MGHCKRRKRKKKRKKKNQKRDKRMISPRKKRRKKNPKEYGKPTYDEHWGMCDKQCLNNNPRFIIQG